MIAIGAIAVLLLFVREAKRREMDHKLLTDVVIYSLLGGIIEARIVYEVVYNPSLYYLSLSSKFSCFLKISKTPFKGFNRISDANYAFAIF